MDYDGRFNLSCALLSFCKSTSVRSRAGPLFRLSEMVPQAVLLDSVSDGPPSHWEVGNPIDCFSRSNQRCAVLICASMTDKSFSNDGNVCSGTHLSSTWMGPWIVFSSCPPVLYIYGIQNTRTRLSETKEGKAIHLKWENRGVRCSPRFKQPMNINEHSLKPVVPPSKWRWVQVRHGDVLQSQTSKASRTTSPAQPRTFLRVTSTDCNAR